MKISIKTLLTTLGTLALAACSHEGHEAHEHDHEAGHIHSEAEGHDHHADEHAEARAHGEIVLEPEMAEKFDVVTEVVASGKFQEGISVSGQIVNTPLSSAIVSAPTSGIVTFSAGIEQGADVNTGAVVARISSKGITGGDADEAARLTMENAKKEVDRLAPLHADGIVSTRDYNAAVQAYDQARAAYSQGAASGTAKAPASGVISQLLVQQGQYVEAGAPIASISSAKRLSLRADLPERYYQQATAITDASVEVPGTGRLVSLSELGGKRGGEAMASEGGYIPVYFNFDNNGLFAPGSYVKAMLLTGERDGVLSVPVTALSEQQGAYFVYQKLDDECYKKVPVRVGATNGTHAEIVAGLSGGEEIVTNGTTAVRLAEQASVAPEGHSHNH